jgi:hypothetical protein
VNHLRLLREGPKHDELLTNDIMSLYQDTVSRFPREWLLRLELIELASKTGFADTEKLITRFIADTKSQSDQLRWLVDKGLELRSI